MADAARIPLVVCQHIDCMTPFLRRLRACPRCGHRNEELRPTPAQRRWLVAIGAGGVTISGTSWVHGMRNRGGMPAKSTYVVTCDLHDAGWIAKLPAKDSTIAFPRFDVYLTDAGKAAIATDAHAPFRAQIRARGQRVTPFSLGKEVGKSGQELALPNPYALGSRNSQHYLDGQIWGQRERRASPTTGAAS